MASAKTEVNRERVKVVRLVYKFDGPAYKVVLQALNFSLGAHRRLWVHTPSRNICGGWR